jgi:conjugal transfer mating pair stabilization protein TraN
MKRTLFIAVVLSMASTVTVSGDCILLSTVCAEGPETRVINGVEVYRECWRYHSEYECLAVETVEHQYCAELRERGCSQVSSSCITTSDYGCMTYEQTYECPSDQPPAEQAVLDCGGQLFCLEGSCFDTGYPPNTNMGRAGAMLSVMEALSDELSVDTVQVFKGEDRRCGISLFDAIGAHNCCKVDGWAEGVFECSFNEKLLADLRQAKRCHHVGTYCSDRDSLGICWEDTQTHCCFNSKLSRIIAEQGRPQLGKGWGSPQSPDCSGFTMEEVASLDFEAMDLSEFYADVIASMPTLNADDLQNRMTDRMTQQMP